MSRNASDSLSYVYSPSIFIGGHSRSGTTLIQGLICTSNDTINITAESSYIRELVWAFAQSNKLYKLHTYDYFDKREDFIHFHREIIEKYLKHVSDRFAAGKVLVQKEPRMTYVFPEISYLMPNARFVVMIRDVRDIIASQVVRFAKSGKQLDVDAELKRFVETHRRLIRHRKSLKNRLLYVRYERLAYYPNETLDEVARFLKISLSGELSETTWPTRRDPRDESATALEGQPPSKSRVGAYRSALEKDIIEKVENVMPEISKKIHMDCFAADDPEDGKRFPNTKVLT